MEDAAEAAVTYTKDGHKKKNRRWLDGKLKINFKSREGCLFSEDGQSVASGKIPEDIQIAADSDEFQLGNSKSILVVISELLSGGTAASSPKPFAAGTGGQENAVPPVFTGGASRPVLRRGFSRPQSVPVAVSVNPTPFPASSSNNYGDQPAADHSSYYPAETPLHHRHHHQQIAQQQQQMQQRQQRSASDILRLLGKREPLNPAPAAPQVPQQQGTAAAPPPPRPPQHGAAAAAEIPFQQPPPAKRPRTVAATSSGASWGPKPSVPAERSRLPQLQGGFGAARPNANANATGSAATAGPALHRVSPPATGTGIYFPSKEECSRPLRRVAVPDRFAHTGAYLQRWTESLREEITLKITEGAKDFYSAAAQDGANASAAALEAVIRRSRVPYHSNCEIFIWRKNPNYGSGKRGGGGGEGRRKKGDGDDEDDAAPVEAETVYLKLKNGRGKGEDYGKDDVWVVSNDPGLRAGFDPGVVGDSSRAPWTAVVRSLWFGPNQDGKMEVEFLSPKPPNLGRSTPVYALKGPNAHTELQLLDLLAGPAPHALPLMPSLIGTAALDAARPAVEPTTAAPLAEPSTPQEHAAAFSAQFKLNTEQSAVLRHVASWALPSSSPDACPPVCLVFGPFGTGKSSLLVALLRLIITLRKQDSFSSDGGGSNPLVGARVLVAAHTNVAVDRVMLGLAESGCAEFVRVGPLRRIDRRLLPHSLHASESKASASAAAELKEMLKEGAGKMSPEEEKVLRDELAAAERGADRQRKKLLKTAPVVGITCCSSLLSTLENLTFDVVVIDEASQIIEPLALAPVMRAKARFLVAAGDPRQLPPVVAHPQLVAAGPQQHSGGASFGLLRPLFVRLSTLGAAPHMLRRQYRCHPAVSTIPNSLFYNGRLLDGCAAADRPPLLPGLPPVVVVDVRGQEQRNMRSTSNADEANAAVRVLESFLAAGVHPSRCGVICFYRAQVGAVNALVEQRAGRLHAAMEAGQEHTAAAAAGSSIAGKQGEEEEEEGDAETAAPSGGVSGVQIATVDAFQGAEKDVIILTTATTRPGSFAADAARLNVALTRGRHHLVLVGHAQALERTAPAFASVIKAAKASPGGYFAGGAVPMAAAVAGPFAAALRQA